MQSAETLIKLVRQRVDALPQRGAIVEADARQWIDHVVGEFGDLALWHATRAGGFGGSQIGALVKNFAGERADHSSAHDIVAGALLRRVPDESNGQMRRGMAMEPQHRRWFHEKHSSDRDQPGFDLLSKSVGPRAWMRYSPDDLAYMGEGNKQRILIDYKSPTNVERASMVAFEYTCQLHMGRLVCEHNGLKIDGLMLSQFDWQNWAIKDDEVPILAELDELIVRAGDQYWDCVLRGEVPSYVGKPRLKDEQEMREKLGTAPLMLARLKAMSSVIGSHVERLEEVVKPEIAKRRLGRNKVVLDGISFSASPKFTEAEVLGKLPTEVFEALPLFGNATKAYDDKAMLKKLKELGVDVKQFAKPGSVDADALYEALVAHGIDADALMGEQVSGRLDKDLVADVRNWFEREFAELLPPKEKNNAEQAQADAATDGREGQEMSSYALRPVAA